MGRAKTSDFEYKTDDIIIGYGEVKAVHTEEGLKWALPGFIYTACRDEAIRVAEKLDRMVQANVKRFDRELVW